MNIRRLIEEVQIVPAFIPGADNNADLTGDWVSFKNFNNCLVVYHKAAGTAGDDPAIRLQQATVVAGSDAKALAFNRIYYKVGATALSAIGTFSFVNLTTPSDDVDLDTINSSALDLLSDVGESIICIEVKADDLDVSNGFDCMNLIIEGDDFANANLCCAYYIMYNPRHAGGAAGTALEAIAD